MSVDEIEDEGDGDGEKAEEVEGVAGEPGPAAQDGLGRGAAEDEEGGGAGEEEGRR